MLSVKGIESFYGTSQVLFGMELEVNDGEVVTLLGRNGMGKTTTLSALMGIVPARAGKVTFDGTDITALPSYKIAQLGLGLVPEGAPDLPKSDRLGKPCGHSGRPARIPEPLDRGPGVQDVSRTRQPPLQYG